LQGGVPVEQARRMYWHKSDAATLLTMTHLGYSAKKFG
jgi:hypothetical protein